MGHFLSQFVTDFLRQAIPVLGATIGAFYGTQLAVKKGKNKLAFAAMFGGAGWISTYLVQSLVLNLAERKMGLPKETLPMLPPATSTGAGTSLPFDLNQATLAPVPDEGTLSGLNIEVDPYAVTGSPSNVPQPSGDAVPPKVPNQEGVRYGIAPATPSKKNRTLNLGAYGGMGN